MKKILITIFTIIFVLVADLTTKHFLFNITYFNLIPHVISIATNGGNTGAAFGAFGGKTVALIIVSVLMLVALLIFSRFIEKKTVTYRIGFGLILGGALGNLIDRVVLGYVRDFIYLDFWSGFPTFNIADACLCVGVAIVAVYLLFKTGHKHGNKNIQ